MSGSASFQRVSLLGERLCRFCLLLRWRENDKDNANDNERRYVPEQVSAFTRIFECLHRHNGGVNET